GPVDGLAGWKAPRRRKANDRSRGSTRSKQEPDHRLPCFRTPSGVATRPVPQRSLPRVSHSVAHGLEGLSKLPGRCLHNDRRSEHAFRRGPRGGTDPGFYTNDREQALAAMEQCDVLLANSREDGMNLVVK